MNHIHKILNITLLSASISLPCSLLQSCNEPIRDQGRTNQVRTDSRGPVEHGKLGSKELENTTDVMLESIVESLDDLKKDETGNTVIVMDQIINRSPLPTDDMEIFLAQLRRKLNNSGVKYQIVFVEQPGRASAVRGRVLEDGLKNDYEEPGMRPHYALTGDVYAIEETGARYWEIFFKLLDLDPNARYRNEIRWENSAGYRFAR